MNPHLSAIRSLPTLLTLALILSACVPPGGGPPPGPQTGLSITNLDDAQTLSGTVAVNAGGVGGNAVGLTFTLGTLTAQADGTGTGILDTRSVADGDHLLEVSATVAGTAVSANITVTIDNTLPTSGTVGAAGGALGTPSGSIAILPPGALDGDTTLTLIDTGQPQILADFGVDYEALGVTFLGALTIDAGSDNGTRTRHPIQVDLAGQTQFVQPGQDVIMFAVAPDADGDGVGELMFAANAIATEGGSVITMPELRAKIYGFSAANGSLRTQQAAARPGEIVTLQGRGFLPGGFLSNVATFASGESLVFLPTLTDPSNFASTMEIELAVPALGQGDHTVRFTNLTTDFESDPLELTIGALGGGNRSTWDAFVAQLDAALQGVTAGQSSLAAFGATLVAELGSVTSPTAFAMAGSSGLVSAANLSLLEGIDGSSYSTDQRRLVYHHALLLDAIAVSVNTQADAAADLASLLLLATPQGSGAPALRTQQRSGSCGGSGGDIVFGTPTGMGSAPSGSCSNGSAGGTGSGSPLRSQRLGGVGPVAGALVRLLIPGTNEKLIPLTSITDAAGYYSFPFVPPGEPFTLQAIDPSNGATATADGVAGAVAELVTVPLVFAPAVVTPGSPTAAFTVASTGLVAVFDAGASSDDGAVEEYIWDFGDGTAAVTTANPTIEHRYVGFGTVTVTLTVVDDEANTGATSKSVTLELGPGTPTASFTATPVAGALPGVFTFDASTSSDPDSTIVAYVWDFGDETPVETVGEAEVEHAFLRDPSAEVSLTVIDDAGQFDSAEQLVDTGVTQPYFGGPVELVSVAQDGTAGNKASFNPVINGDGSRIAFLFRGTSFEGGESRLRALHKDMNTGELLGVLTTQDGTFVEGNLITPAVAIDGTGQQVAFNSSAVGLVDNPVTPPTFMAIYLKNALTGEVTEIPHPVSPGNAGFNPSVSADVQKLAFSFTNSLGTTIFVQDLLAGTFTSFAAEDPAGTDTPKLSADGNFVVYHDPVDRSQLLVRDLDTSDVFRVTETADGTPGDGFFSLNPSISADGRYVVFESDSSNFAGIPGGVNHIYLKDLDTGEIELISRNVLGEAGNSTFTDIARSPSISGDGRYVAFESMATNLVPGVDPSNGDYFVYVKDLVTGWIAVVSVDIEQPLPSDLRQSALLSQGFVAAATPRISQDGRYIAFFSGASTLVPGDTNGFADIFRAENPLWEPPTP